jgi:hypothetical protein
MFDSWKVASVSQLAVDSVHAVGQTIVVIRAGMRAVTDLSAVGSGIKTANN